MSDLMKLVQCNHRIPSWAKQIVTLLARSQDKTEDQWWDEAFRLKLEQDWPEVEGVLDAASDFIGEQRRVSENYSAGNGKKG